MAGGERRFELLTPRGHGGVAVVAVRGDDRWALVEEFVRLGAPPASDGGPEQAADGAAGRGPWLGVLYCAGVRVDEVLLVDRPAVRILEIHLHGSPAVVAAFEGAVSGFGASSGGRADRFLRTAQSREQLALALEQGAVDFAGFLAGSPSPTELDEAEARSRIAWALTRPCRLVICGDQNAGKSTLMNRLLFRERVVTGAFPGLTRDPVAEGALLDGYPYEVIDTAGEGPVRAGEAAAIDRQALDLARRERRDGLRLLVVEGSRVPSTSDVGIRDANTLVVRSKADLPAAAWPDDFVADVTVSCLAADSAPEVRTAVGRVLRRMRALPRPGPVGGVAALTHEELRRIEQAHDEI